ncbi:diguanylate phosphodiesterase [Poseidonocella pacifica]|uniref:Diguanylate phosphodiesterase n=1 Tax=Poseidonocella pacifica TaxID=871651 RepID=A0A1I0WQQ6_9RHOB|nr:EAL domain-containing protein [Poseidonocella pacifica]SFA90490.1 diguanylate phosphodiesterase [Poseidonocella pacifica]
MADDFGTNRGNGGVSSPLDLAVEQRDRNTLRMVQEAVAAGDLTLAYQPVVQARQTDQVAFYEGLMRIIDETGRIIPAADFMYAVEDTDTGREIDRAALAMGMRTLMMHSNIRISVNMSARSIGYEPWMHTLNQFLTEEPGIGERLILEITESSAMLMPDLVVDFMDRLQAHGVAFALDDFGSGYTAFRYFKDFFFDAVKIDGQFISGIHRSEDNQVLTQALVMIARHFDMFSVAENVESEADARYLASIGVNCLQGYLFGAPTTEALFDGAPQRNRQA